MVVNHRKQWINSHSGSAERKLLSVVCIRNCKGLAAVLLFWRRIRAAESSHRTLFSCACSKALKNNRIAFRTTSILGHSTSCMGRIFKHKSLGQRGMLGRIPIDSASDLVFAYCGKCSDFANNTLKTKPQLHGDFESFVISLHTSSQEIAKSLRARSAPRFRGNVSVGEVVVHRENRHARHTVSGGTDQAANYRSANASDSVLQPHQHDK